jgi:hypothetical protein
MMNKWIAALALAAMSLTAHAGTANVSGDGTEANPYQMGSLLVGSTSTLSTWLLGDVGEEFEEHANFNVAQDLSLYGSASTLTLTIWGMNVVGIDDFAVELWDGTHPFGSTFYTEFDGSNTTVRLGVLSAGQYHLDMYGTLGANIGQYAVTLAAAPVPEPSTYALLLAGLGVVGFVARRRRQMV